MPTLSDDNDQPAFAATIASILERYKAQAVERYNAIRALTAITLALAPEWFFERGDEARMDAWFGRQLDAHREGGVSASVEVIGLISAAADGNRGEMDRRMR